MTAPRTTLQNAKAMRVINLAMAPAIALVMAILTLASLGPARFEADE